MAGTAWGCDVEVLRSRRGDDEAGPAPAASPTPLSSPAIAAPAPAPPSQVAPPPGAPRSFAELAAQVDPAVVFVRRKDARRFTDGFRLYQENVESGTGSGFVFDAQQGLILTNHHVVGGASELLVELVDGRTVPARAVGLDELTDVAVLQIRAEGLTAVPLGDSDSVRVGDWVLALGNPFGLSHTVSAGILSGRDRSNTDPNSPRAYVNYLQTDAAINPGNSGGPLVDLSGHVIGINSAIIGGANTIGFAIPINMVRELVPLLLVKGRIERSAIGVEIDEVPGRPHGGALIAGVLRSSPAHEAGFQPGDVAVRVGEHEVTTPERFRWWVSLSEPGKEIPVVVRRGDREVVLNVVPVLRDRRR